MSSRQWHFFDQSNDDGTIDVAKASSNGEAQREEVELCIRAERNGGGGNFMFESRDGQAIGGRQVDRLDLGGEHGFDLNCRDCASSGMNDIIDMIHEPIVAVTVDSNEISSAQPGIGGLEYAPKRPPFEFASLAVDPFDEQADVSDRARSSESTRVFDQSAMGEIPGRNA